MYSVAQKAKRYELTFLNETDSYIGVTSQKRPGYIKEMQNSLALIMHSATIEERRYIMVVPKLAETKSSKQTTEPHGS